MPNEDYSGGRRTAGDAAILWRIVKLALQNRTRVIIAVVATLVAVVLQLLVPRLLGDAVDGALLSLGDEAIDAEVARAALWTTAGLLFAVSVLRGAFTLIHNYGGESIGHLVGYQLRLDFYAKLQKLNFAFHDSVHTGDLVTRGLLDIEGVRMFFNMAVLRSLSAGRDGGRRGGPDAVDRRGPWPVELELCALRRVAARQPSGSSCAGCGSSFKNSLGVLGRIMDENLTGIRVVRAFGAEAYEMKQYDGTALTGARYLTSADRRAVVGDKCNDVRLFYRDGAGSLGRRPARAGRQHDRRHAHRIPDLHDDPAATGAP